MCIYNISNRLSHFVLASDEKTKDGFVRVIVGTKGLKTSRKLKGMKLVKVAENANVDLQFPSERYTVLKNFPIAVKILTKKLKINKMNLISEYFVVFNGG